MVADDLLTRWEVRPSITDDGADYLMPVKERQSALHGELVEALSPLETEEDDGPSLSLWKAGDGSREGPHWFHACP